MWKQLRGRKKQCSWNCGRGSVAEAVTGKDAECKLEHWGSLLGRILLFGFRLSPSVSGLQERNKGRAAIQSFLIYNELISELQTNREDQEAMNLLNKTWIKGMWWKDERLIFSLQPSVWLAAVLGAQGKKMAAECTSYGGNPGCCV